MTLRLSKLFLIVFLFTCLSCQFRSSHRIPLIIDADTANEVDDLFALARAILAPELNLLGITSAQFHISPLASDTSVLESQKINEDLLNLMHRLEISHPVGSNFPLADKHLPQISPASKFIVEQSRNFTSRDPLNLVILGSCTNVASAILQEPEIVSKIRVLYLGFWHDPVTNIYDKKEFNSGNDTLAINVLLDAPGLDFTVMTATTSQELVFTKSEVEQHFLNKGGVAEYLLQRWEAYDRWWTNEDPQKLTWIMWDVALIGALIRPELATKRSFATPQENLDRTIEIYTKIDVKAMKSDFWKSF